METVFSFNSLVSFFILCALEMVLGIDNIIFIAIISQKLPKEQAKKARTMGLSLAIISRIALLISLSWVMSLTATLFTLFGQEISGKDVILILGGLFLITKSTHEIHQKFEAGERAHSSKKSAFFLIILQILLLDMVFSLDSVITAVGMVNNIPIMAAAVIVATVIMIFASHSIAAFVMKYPTIKLLALSFLVLIGVSLIAEGLDTHIPKGYIYFAIAYSLSIEILSSRLKKKGIKT
ncbi:MAG: TerC family protein [Chlamydiota bacterium]